MSRFENMPFGKRLAASVAAGLATASLLFGAEEYIASRGSDSQQLEDTTSDLIDTITRDLYVGGLVGATIMLLARPEEGDDEGPDRPPEPEPDRPFGPRPDGARVAVYDNHHFDLAD